MNDRSNQCMSAVLTQSPSFSTQAQQSERIFCFCFCFPIYIPNIKTQVGKWSSSYLLVCFHGGERERKRERERDRETQKEIKAHTRMPWYTCWGHRETCESRSSFPHYMGPGNQTQVITPGASTLNFCSISVAQNFFETKSLHITQVSIKLKESSSLSIPNTGFTDVHHHSWATGL